MTAGVMPRATANPGGTRAGGDFHENYAAEYDFVVVGSGAGGSIAAAVLAESGARVAIVEEGGHFSRRDFNMQEAWAYPNLYQERTGTARPTIWSDHHPARSVGRRAARRSTGRRVVPHVPDSVLALWARRHGVQALDAAALAPHFAAVEQRLSIGPGVDDDVNRNNRKLWDGATKLGWQPELIRRSVKGCARLGYCGMGCPLDAKQSALITYVPDAMAAGADLYTDCRARLIETDGRRARAVVIDPLDRALDRPTGRRVVLHAKRGVVLAGGAINTPALLLRSHVGNGSSQVGRRTFLHPTVPLVAFYAEPIEAFYGPPQSVACHHFRDRGEQIGYFFETAPIHPMLASADGVPRTSAPGTASPWNASPTRRRPSPCSSTGITTTRAAASVWATMAGSRSRIRSATPTAKPPSTPSPTWRACSWRRAPSRSGPCTTSRS